MSHPEPLTSAEAVDDLILRASAYRESAKASGDDPADPAFLRAHFAEGNNYDARWSLIFVFEGDDVEGLRRALDAGFPLDAPCAFAHGPAIAQAVMSHANQCVAEFLKRGANPNGINEHGDFVLDVAAEVAAEYPQGVEAFKLLVAQGAATDAPTRAKLAASSGLCDSRRPPRAPGAIFLASLARDWADVHAWNVQAANDSQTLLSAISERWEALWSACGEPDIDQFAGAPVEERLDRLELPLALGASWIARRDAKALAASTPDPEARNPCPPRL